MLVLGIETSSYEGSVALERDGVCLDERLLNQVGRRHAQSLVAEIGAMLRNQGLMPRDVDVIAVSQGPGSFTGLRVGMVAAKTFAYATQCRFVAVDTFAAIAENIPHEVTRLLVIDDAQRDELFVGEYLRKPQLNWDPVSPIHIVSVDAFLSHRTIADIISGPGLRKVENRPCVAMCLTDPAHCQPRASVIARLGRLSLTTNPAVGVNEKADFWRATPFYLRLSAAEEKRASLDAQV